MESSYWSAHHVLPVSLFAALAMSSTSATAYYAYSTILCQDPRHCQGDETRKYAGFIAIAISVSNVLGIIALGPLQRISEKHQRLGLVLWTGVRSMSSIMLLAGVNLNNIYVALSGRIFEGIASDNLLHFMLNMIYAQAFTQEATSLLIGYSLALYMVGVSTSPFVAGLFESFTTSFFMALGLFGVTGLYLQLWLNPKTPTKHIVCTINNTNTSQCTPNPRLVRVLRSTLLSFINPVRTLAQRPTSLLCATSLFVYNLVQSYTFTALLVHTSLKFGFTSKENGLIVTTAHSIGAFYIFTVLFVLPRLSRFLSLRPQIDELSMNTGTKDGILAMISLLLQASSILSVGLATKPWQIYIGTALLAVGLPTPSFLKAYMVGLYDGLQKRELLAALAAMEVIGDMLGPMILGGWQSYTSSNASIFFMAAGMVMIALSLFVSGFALNYRNRANRFHEEVEETY